MSQGFPPTRDYRDRDGTAHRSANTAYGESNQVRHAKLASLAKWCQEAIEELVEGPPLYSLTAFTPNHTAFTVIRNGVPKVEGEKGWPPVAPLDMVADSIRFARRMRAEINGPAALIWRCTPAFEEDGTLYMRLCFEPLLTEAL
jgi:hypothetical protein